MTAPDARPQHEHRGDILLDTHRMATMGHTLTSLIKPMVTGYEDLDEPAGES